MGTTNTLDLNNRVDKLEKAVSGGDSAQANKTDIATEFSATTNYTAGCFVYYGGKLYQFNADHSAGAWDPTDVVEANVTDQIVSNKSAIEGLTASDITYDNTDSGLTATELQGAVDEVVDNMGVVSGTFTADAGVTVLHSKLRKQLNIVSLDIFCQKNLTANQWNHVGDIQADFAPDTYNMYFPGLNDTDVGFFESKIEGTSIDVYPTVSGTKNFSLVTAYINTN